MPAVGIVEIEDREDGVRTPVDRLVEVDRDVEPVVGEVGNEPDAARSKGSITADA